LVGWLLVYAISPHAFSKLVVHILNKAIRTVEITMRLPVAV
jgi:hypothetical protein